MVTKTIFITTVIGILYVCVRARVQVHIHTDVELEAHSTKFLFIHESFQNSGEREIL